MAYNYEYPYTDVHRHNDDWMINRVKELSLEWLKTQQEWNNTQEEFTSLKTFIQNYFAELDVQDEVNTKLDIMVRDGTLGYVTPEMFGAIGDGISDDYEALQNALNTKIPVIGGIGKKYYSTSTLMAYSDIKNLEIILDTSKYIFYKGINNIKVRECKFRMLGEVIGEFRGEYCLVFHNSNNIEVKDCYFEHFTNNIFGYHCDNLKFINNYFYDSIQNNINGYGIVLEACKDIIIDGNIFKDIQRHSIYLSCNASEALTRCENTIIVNNTFISKERKAGYNTTGFECQISCRNPIDTLIAQNYFDGCVGGVVIGFSQFDNGSILNCENLTIQSNTFKNMENPARRAFGCGVIYHPQNDAVGDLVHRNIKIINNEFINNDMNDIKLCQYHDIFIDSNTSYGGEAEFSFLRLSHETDNDATLATHIKNLILSNNRCIEKRLMHLEHMSYGKIENIKLLDNICDYTIRNTKYMCVVFAALCEQVEYEFVGNNLIGAYRCLQFLGNQPLTNLVMFNNRIKGVCELFTSDYEHEIKFAFNRDYTFSNKPKNVINTWN